MKRTMMMAAALALVATPVLAETVHVGVNGLVCAFCVKGIQKGFSKLPNVASAEVDLDKKLVTLTSKPNQSISDAAIKQTIEDTGYSLSGIHHEK